MTPSADQRLALMALGSLEQVIAEPLRFKAKLAIGENAYQSLRVINKGRELWDMLGAAGTGAAVAKSGLVATTFFAPSGMLAAIGIGTAATPLGWIAFAALASGGACYGVYRMFGSSRDARVIEIPRFLNTPLDALALSLFDLISPLALRLASVDGEIEPSERAALVEHLVEEWGFDAQFVALALSLLESQLKPGQVQDVAAELAAFLHTNPDCNHAAISADLGEFLRRLLEAGGPLSDAEQETLVACITTLEKTPDGSLSKAWLQARFRVAQAADVVGDSLNEVATRTKAVVPFKEALRSARDATVGQAREAGQRVGALASRLVPEPALAQQAVKRSVAIDKAGIEMLKERFTR